MNKAAGLLDRGNPASGSAAFFFCDGFARKAMSGLGDSACGTQKFRQQLAKPNRRRWSGILIAAGYGRKGGESSARCLSRGVSFGSNSNP